MTETEKTIKGMDIEAVNAIGEMLIELFNANITHNCKQDIIDFMEQLADDYGYSGLASIAIAYINR